MPKLSKSSAKRLWIQAQKLDSPAPFGSGAAATQACIEHLGYVQIDTISVIERCHHHILFTRNPSYRTIDLHHLQSKEKSVFEYWTHALSYVPTRDFRFFAPDMKRREKSPSRWFEGVRKPDLKKIMRRIEKEGAISIRDVTDDVLVEKDHEWASTKPSKRVLQLGFNIGQLVVSERLGMLKKYELADRHFDWVERPKAASEKEVSSYFLDRALKAQAVVSLDSICHLNAPQKAGVKKIIDQRVKNNELVEVKIKDVDKVQFWAKPESLEQDLKFSHEMTHILSPFDPLIIQRKRLNHFFDYEHIFEAYIPKEKRVYGYFSLPILIEDQIVAVLDLKTDRQAQKLLIQKWTWLKKHKSASLKKKIEAELHRFEKFQLGL